MKPFQIMISTLDIYKGIFLILNESLDGHVMGVKCQQNINQWNGLSHNHMANKALRLFMCTKIISITLD